MNCEASLLGAGMKPDPSALVTDANGEFRHAMWRQFAWLPARVGRIDRSTREATSPLHAVLYVCHPRLVNHYLPHNPKQIRSFPDATKRRARRIDFDARCARLLGNSPLEIRGIWWAPSGTETRR